MKILLGFMTLSSAALVFFMVIAVLMSTGTIGHIECKDVHGPNNVVDTQCVRVWP